jgi:MoxR-like ATPase
MSDGAAPPVLLIDEVDRSDEEFEAFLLEVLSDFQITIPEIGTIKAERRPFVILTSNRTREIHDALKRRCLYLWLDYPTFEKEYQIVRAKIPGIQQALAEQICTFMQKLRQINFYKRPGIAETLDWAQALLHLNQAGLVPETIRDTVGCILKYHEDVEKFKRDEMERVLLEF